MARISQLLAFVAAVGLFAAGAAQAQTATTQAQAEAPVLVKFEIRNGAIPASLTGSAGDPERGKKVVVGRRLGNCIACHQVTTLAKEPYHGNTGPSLDGVAARLSEGELRLRIVDSTKANPDTMMPAFYRNESLNRVMPAFQGKTILTAEQVEDVVAFLLTLK